MSTELLTNMQDNNVTLFWGGETRGMCLQVSSRTSKDGASFIHLTMEDAVSLQKNIKTLIKKERKRRRLQRKQGLK